MSLAACLAVLGLVLAAAGVAQVRLGLRPLDRLRQELEAVRAGRRERVPDSQPVEVRPLAAEINALLDQNAAQLAQARTHVANLAHGLKTPLATLSLALSEPGRDPDGRLSQLAAHLDRSVRHHLRRARSAALTGATRLRTELAGPVTDLAGALERLHAEKGVRVTCAVPPGLAAACDPQDLDEMLGNLVDNACTWCTRAVRVSAEGSGGEVVVAIEDDGPGLGQAALAAVAQRGRRLDETVPGHGFGSPSRRNWRSSMAAGWSSTGRRWGACGQGCGCRGELRPLEPEVRSPQQKRHPPRHLKGQSGTRMAQVLSSPRGRGEGRVDVQETRQAEAKPERG